MSCAPPRLGGAPPLTAPVGVNALAVVVAVLAPQLQVCLGAAEPATVVLDIRVAGEGLTIAWAEAVKPLPGELASGLALHAPSADPSAGVVEVRRATGSEALRGDGRTGQLSDPPKQRSLSLQSRVRKWFWLPLQLNHSPKWPPGFFWNRALSFV